MNVPTGVHVVKGFDDLDGELYRLILFELAFLRQVVVEWFAFDDLQSCVDHGVLGPGVKDAEDARRNPSTAGGSTITHILSSQDLPLSARKTSVHTPFAEPD